MNCPYFPAIDPGVASLRDDITRFTFLLGESDGEGLFSPRAPD
jgi:hypothetical protein